MLRKNLFFVVVLAFFASSLFAQTTYSVLDFGAKGDGVTDDAAAIQRAIDKCSSEGGGRVLLPRQHTYLCGSPWPTRPSTPVRMC